MKVLVLNSGSSSLKYQLLNMPEATVLAEGLVDRIGIEGGNFSHKANGEKTKFKKELANHKEALTTVLELLTTGETAVVSSIKEIDAVGHRVVHGGEKFTKSVVVTPEVMEGIEQCVELAPLHNPANIQGIVAMQEIMPSKPQVVVFDTAFHQTMKPENFLYAVPYNWYEKYGVRRYGFHGTSHKFVSERAAEILENKDLRIVNCHVGNGASVAAINAGEVVETSMGFTPLEGLVMGTRAGDMDPAIVSFVQKKENISADEMDTILNKKSGVLGLSEISSDMRDIEDGMANGDEKATNAMNVYINRIVKYIGSYTALMGGVDVITFTAGALENSSVMRKLIVDKL
jgi:acetate kinase